MLFACPLFPWLGFIFCLCAPLLFSVWLPSLGIFPCLALLGFLPPFLLWLSFVVVARCVLCPSLPLVFHFAVLGCPPVAWWPSVFFWPCSLLFSALEVTFSCLGFSALRVRVSCWSSTGFFFRAPLLSFLPLGYSCFVGVHCVPCSSLLYILLVTWSFSVFSDLSFFNTDFRLSSSSYLLSLLGFVPFLLLPRLPLLCLYIGSSWCVSSYDWASYFLVLCFGCFVFDFLRVFASCLHFLGLLSSWRGFAAA